jgi:hypothetical protein
MIPRQSMRTAYAGGALYYAARGDVTGFRVHMLGLMIATIDREHRMINE